MNKPIRPLGHIITACKSCPIAWSIVVRFRAIIVIMLTAFIFAACRFEFEHPLSLTHKGKCPLQLNGKWEQDMTQRGGEGPSPMEFKISVDCKKAELFFGSSHPNTIRFNLIFTQINNQYYISATTTDEINKHKRYMLFKYEIVDNGRFKLYFGQDRSTMDKAIKNKTVEGYIGRHERVITAKGESLRQFVKKHNKTFFVGPAIYQKVYKYSEKGRHYGPKSK